MVLYKYSGPAGVAILRDRSIWLTEPRGFADPFEQRPGGRVLSLSLKRDSLPMWRHYAAAHTGLVIGFDAFEGICLTGAAGGFRLAPVVYTSARSSASGQTSEQTLLTKSDDWEYEDEWRVVDAAFPGDAERADSERSPHSLLAIRPESVQEVIVGCRADADLRAGIASVLGRPEYAHVHLFEAVPDDRHYWLNVIERPR